VLLGGDANIIPTRLVPGERRGYIGVDMANPPGVQPVFWTGGGLLMHALNPGERWPGGTPHVLVNPGNGTLIPYDAAGTSNAATPGWYYTTDNTYSVRTPNRTEFVVVNGPAALINTTLQWLYEWNQRLEVGRSWLHGVIPTTINEERSDPTQRQCLHTSVVFGMNPLPSRGETPGLLNPDVGQAIAVCGLPWPTHS
jgi:hypothetical protein